MTYWLIYIHLFSNYIIIKAKKKDIVEETIYENMGQYSGFGCACSIFSSR